jgi:Fe-Mn family superoxide dismutase
VVIMDVFEHAYMIDYGVKKADYVRAFLRHLDWKTAAERLDGARSEGGGGEKASGRGRKAR